MQALEKIEECLRIGREYLLSGVPPGARAFLLHALFRHSDPGVRRLLPEQIVTVTPDFRAAEEMAASLSFWRRALSGGLRGEILLFPADDTFPYDEVSPHPEVTARRLEVLHRLARGEPSIVVVPVKALLERVIPPAIVGEAAVEIRPNEIVPREGLVERLISWGYSRVPLVEDRGDFSVRGEILDVFPPMTPKPLRITFYDDLIDTVRTFDPETQRSREELAAFTLIPAREILDTPEIRQRALSQLGRLEGGGYHLRRLREEIKGGIRRQGIENYLPLFYEPARLIDDYAPTALLVLSDRDEILARARAHCGEIERRYENAIELGRPAFPPEERFLSTSGFDVYFQRLLETHPLLRFSTDPMPEEEGGAIHFEGEDNEARAVALRRARREEAPLQPLLRAFNEDAERGMRLFVTAPSLGNAHRVAQILDSYPIEVELVAHLRLDDRDPSPRLEEGGLPRVTVTPAPFSHGFRLPEFGISVVTEREIFGERFRSPKSSPRRVGPLVSSIAQLTPGDPVIHRTYGLGIYRGLETREAGGTVGDFLLIEYAGGDRLWLPADRLDALQRYIGIDGVAPKIDKLGGKAWNRAKARARAAAQKIAGELLSLYAARQVVRRPPLPAQKAEELAFAEAFPYELTPDQERAIEAVLADLSSLRPMDRLICGDVGFGKTEVAIRAAFRTVMSGRQVAVLVPTTILALQHDHSFRERFSGTPVTIASLSRLKKPAEQRRVIEHLKSGGIDIVIGTHRLLQKDVDFKNLGLLVIDEEHRFGVRHKEKIKTLRKKVDVLALTATPIPRTLHMALSGIRELSVIETPPADRLAIRTTITTFRDDIVIEAIRRERSRGGQVFFVHNRIESIAACAERLHRLVPEARIAVAHGQMEAPALEEIMIAFHERRYDILVCTTIIESGLDIPTANTIFIDRADTFGLAQLYQLRGRVGRSHHRAYCYLLVPPRRELPPDAQKRLAAMEELTTLGSGFKIAAHDLSIRGAGNMLGREQSGQIAAVGFELYTELLSEAVRQLRGEDVAEEVTPEVELQVPAYIPEDYVPDTTQRLLLHKRLASALDEAEVEEMKGEFIDRFGEIPEPVLLLCEISRLKVLMRAYRIPKVTRRGKQLTIAFGEAPRLSSQALLEYVGKHPESRLTPDMRLTFPITTPVSSTPFSSEIASVVEEVRTLLHELR